ncbi:MAG: LysM peptidoglycan-binding domain-containing protein [Dehalococcoidia bacterium]
MTAALIAAFGLAGSAAAQQFYVVQPGDTVGGIAAAHDTSVSAIVDANDLASANRIFVGESLVIPGPTEGSDTPPSRGTVYTVQSGDTLGAIATRHGTTASAIAQANGIANPNVVRVGHVLAIPGHTEGSDTPPSTSDTYVVQPGDTLGAIAARHGTSIDVLAQANRIANVNVIEVGQVIAIPGAGDGDNGDDGGAIPAGFTLAALDHTARGGAGVITDVRIAQHQGFDRIVFEFADEWENITVSDGVPGFTVGYVASADECGSGFGVSTEGSSMLRVNFPRAYVYDPNTGESTVPTEFTEDHQVVLQAQEICGFEGQSTWILGVDGVQAYRISELSTPTRLVIDVATN